MKTESPSVKSVTVNPTSTRITRAKRSVLQLEPNSSCTMFAKSTQPTNTENMVVSNTNCIHINGKKSDSTTDVEGTKSSEFPSHHSSHSTTYDAKTSLNESKHESSDDTPQADTAESKSSNDLSKSSSFSSPTEENITLKNGINNKEETSPKGTRANGKKAHNNVHGNRKSSTDKQNGTHSKILKHSHAGIKILDESSESTKSTSLDDPTSNKGTIKESKSNPLTKTTKTTRLEDETESSDACAEYSTDSEDEKTSSRQLRLRKWEKTRRDIGWRMNWINMQLYEFDYQIAQIDEHRKANKRKKALLDSVSLSASTSEVSTKELHKSGSVTFSEPLVTQTESKAPDTPTSLNSSEFKIDLTQSTDLLVMSSSSIFFKGKSLLSSAELTESEKSLSQSMEIPVQPPADSPAPLTPTVSSTPSYELVDIIHSPPIKKRRVGRPRKYPQAASHPLFSIKLDRKTTSPNEPNHSDIESEERDRHSDEDIADLYSEDYQPNKRLKSPQMGVRKVLSSQTPRSNMKKRTRDFDINNMVIPAEQSQVLPTTPKTPKQIFTPTWHEVPDLEHDIANLTASKEVPKSPINEPVIQPEIKKESTPKKNDGYRDIETSKEVDNENPESSDEDTSDEFFMEKHINREMLERMRFLLPCDRNKALPSAPEKLPLEFFLQDDPFNEKKRKKQNQQVDPKKLKAFKKEYKEVKARYLGSTPFERDWDKMKTYVEEVEKHRATEEKLEKERKIRSRVEEGESEFSDPDPNFKFEIVNQTPPINPKTNQPRLILYLRRLKPEAKSENTSLNINVDAPMFISHSVDEQNRPSSPNSLAAPRTPPSVSSGGTLEISTPPRVDLSASLPSIGSSMETSASLENSSEVSSSTKSTNSNLVNSIEVKDVEGSAPPL